MRKSQIIRVSHFGRHLHHIPYAAVVLSGSYEEAGDLGRFYVHAGDVLLHDAVESHLDRFAASGAMILNVRLPNNWPFRAGLGRVPDPDAIVVTAERNELEAAALLLSSLEMQAPQHHDWPDELTAALMQDPSLSLSRWSETAGIPAWSVSRGFARVFGISPASFRARVRARLAWKAVQMTKDPLVTIAVELGFSDQAHMTRSVTALTGKPPQEWRQPANRFKT